MATTDLTAPEELQKLFKEERNDDELATMIDASQRIMGRPANVLLMQMGLGSSTATPFTLLDHACGTGPIAAALQERIRGDILAKSRLVCADFNASCLESVKKRAARGGWAHIELAVLDAQKTEYPDETFSHVTINFALHIIPDPLAVLRDVMRILKPGGIFGFTVWHRDNAGWGPDMRTSFEALPFDAPLPDPLPMTFHGKPDWAEPEGIERELGASGFQNVQVSTEDHMQRVYSAEDFAKSFGMMVAWLQRYWGEESKAEAQKISVEEHMAKHLEEKHRGQGWELKWTFISATCQKPI